MTSPNQFNCRNRLLGLLSGDDFALLAPHLDPVKLSKGINLAETDAVIDHVYFPENGIVSVVAISPEGQEVEAGLFGCDGAGPIALAMGSDRAPNRVQVQVPGDGHRVERTVFVKAMNDSPSFRSLLLRFAQTLAVQTSFTALSNAVHPIDERLARWLLMCHDRYSSDEIPLTHEFISVMLAVRRPSVTTALHVLEGNRFIRSERGSVTIRDRKGLEAFAGDAYGKPEAEYERLIGPMNPSTQAAAASSPTQLRRNHS